jgi:hypothetical protein
MIPASMAAAALSAESAAVIKHGSRKSDLWLYQKEKIQTRWVAKEKKRREKKRERA